MMRRWKSLWSQAVDRAAFPPGVVPGDTPGASSGGVQLPAIMLLSALAALTLTACGGSTETSESGSSAPSPAIAYAGPEVFILRVFDRYDPVSVSPGSTITVSPALPVGLNIDASTGTISGTPAALSAGQEYTVSVADARGTATTTVALEVNDGVLFYSSPAILPLGVAMSPLIPNATTSLSIYSIDPALPEGLSLDPNTGVISGTPTEATPPGYYTVTSTDHTFQREYGLTLGVTDPSAPPGMASAAPFNCTHSGGFLGTFVADSHDQTYGLIAIAFTPDGRAKARVNTLNYGQVYGAAVSAQIYEDDSDGLQALSPAMDGTFKIDFANGNSLSGSFSGPDVISGTYTSSAGQVVKAFTAARLGGSANAQYRYSGGFDENDSTGQEIDFATVDVTGSAISGKEYEMTYSGSNYLLINQQLSFDSTIVNGVFTAPLIDWFTYAVPYTPGQSGLFIGDYLYAAIMSGCQLN